MADKESLYLEGDVVDPIADLLACAASDPGAPFTTEGLAVLNVLRVTNLAEFRRVRAKLKALGVGVTALDDAISETGGDGDDKPTISRLLLEIADEAVLFHDRDHAAFADIEIDGHRETWPVKSAGFRRWLRNEYLRRHGDAPYGEALTSALATIEAKADCDGPERHVCLRVGDADGKLYLDLADPKWDVIEIDADGWRLCPNPPVRFRRPRGMMPLPMPAPGGLLDDLLPFLNLSQNVARNGEFALAKAWLVAAMRSTGPYPVMAVNGEQGAAKSSFSRILAQMVDPSSAPLRRLPKEDRDLFIAANSAHVLAFDNVSGLPPWLSDSFCSLSTGGGFATRQLWSDDEQMIFDAQRPIILNGISDVVSRPDLAERTIGENLREIRDKDRREERKLWADFKVAHPALLGGLLDTVARGLRQLPTTSLEAKPRMADFAVWAVACEAQETAGTFIKAYARNREALVSESIDADPVASAIRALMENLEEWKGSATDLLETIDPMVSESVKKGKDWPKAANALSHRVTRVATNLRKIGIDCQRGKSDARTITILRSVKAGQIPPGSSKPSSAEHNQNDINMLNVGNAADDGRTVAPVWTMIENEPANTVRAPSADKPLQRHKNGDADGVDDKTPATTEVTKKWVAAL